MVFVSTDVYRPLFGIRHFFQKGIEKVYLLYNNLDNFYGELSRKNAEELKKKLEGLIEVEMVGINPEDFDKCLSTLCEILRHEKRKKVYIDVSSTTKIACAVSCAVATLFDVIPYIVIPEEEEEITKSYIRIIEKKKYRRGIDIKEIPVIKAEKFIDEKELKILKTLRKYKVKSASELLQKLSLPVTKGELTKLKYVLEKLEHKKLISTRKLGRTLHIKLERLGKLVESMFS